MNIFRTAVFVKRHWIKMIFLLIILLGGYYYYFSGSQSTIVTETKTEKVARGDLKISVSGSGQIQAQSQVDLKPVIAGDGIDVLEVRVKNNQEVKKGQVIAVLDTEDAMRDIEKAELDLKSVRIKQKQVNKNFSNKTQDDTRERQAQAVLVAQQELSLSKTRSKLLDYYIKAPFDGIITGLSVESGDSISRDTVLASVITREMRAIVALNEVDAAQVMDGDLVKLALDALPELELSGKVLKVDTIGKVSQNVVSYNAEIVLEKQDSKLKPGMSANAEIAVVEKQGILLLANAAIFNIVENKAEVKTAQGNKEIKIGLTDNVYTEIMSGLAEGDAVLVESLASVSQKSQGSVFNSLFRGPSSTRK